LYQPERQLCLRYYRAREVSAHQIPRAGIRAVPVGEAIKAWVPAGHPLRVMGLEV